MKKVLFLLIIFNPVMSFAGIFGPSNYEECVLEKMKGQLGFMVHTAREACRLKFPLAEQEVIIADAEVPYKWCESSNTKQTICVENVSKNIKLTRAEAMFFTDVCEAKQNQSGVKSETDKSMFSDKFTFKTPPGSYKCVTLWFYGFKK